MKFHLNAHKLKNITYLAACVALSNIGFVSCGQKAGTQQAQAPGARAIPVTTSPVERETVTGYAQYPANVVALRETELRAEVSGYLSNVLVSDGAQVSAGQALYEIDKARFEAALTQAKANLSIAEANHAKAQRDVERYEALAAKDAIARQTVDNARTELLNAAAQKEAAQAAYLTAKLNLDRSVIRAPFSGVIGIAQVRQGALVNAGTTLINTISATNPMAVEFQVSENELPQILKLRSRSGNGGADDNISLSLGGGQLYGLHGKITTIDRAINPGTGTITVRAEFNNPDGYLLAGMRGILQLQSTSEQAELVIPYKAITEQLGQTSVYVVGDSSRAEQRVIKLGIKSGDKVVVRDGLHEGEHVITEGLINVRHGLAVTVTNTSATNATGASTDNSKAQPQN